MDYDEELTQEEEECNSTTSLIINEADKKLNN